ncbi:diacylglycerol kinase family protein [Cerasicoccus fimbriatus]|uniref:diacylglycerol kinase family protein n=1 Tax=Cerasicoccus fimbriatus TaxID=3014554 RepID=UPI0022B3E42E|nr:diacylglycerol kinase family protein [Cerasicoccus sp. TK19100]
MLDHVNRGIYYLGGGAITAIVSFFLPWPLMILLLWIAASVLWFGVAYFTSRGRLLFKTEEGRLPFWVKCVLFPVLFGVTVYNIVARTRDGQPGMQRLRDGVWLGRRLLPTDTELIDQSAITAILDVTAEFDTLPRDLLPSDVHYLNVPVMDHEPLNLAQLKRAVTWIHEQRRAGRQVLIHCALGKGRSVMAVLAYFKALAPDRSYEDLLQEIKDIRPIARPNARQWELLNKFAEANQPIAKPRTCLIYNPASGKNSEVDVKQEILELMSPYMDIEVLETTPEINGRERAREALQQDFEQMLVYGGDGTVGEVASALAGEDIPLGIVPGGTANSLSVCLFGAGIFIDPIRHACHQILQGNIAQIDAAKSNHGTYFLLAGIGLEAGMVEKADREKKDESGMLAYLLGGLESVSEQEAFTAMIEIDGETHEHQVSSVVIANAAPSTSVFANGLEVTNFTDGKLDVTVILAGEDEGALSPKAIANLLLSSDTDLDENSAVLRYQGRKVKVSTEPGQSIIIDGETGFNAPIEVECQPKSLKVFCSLDVK